MKPLGRIAWLAAALLGVTAFAGLGTWQWQRGVDKQVRIARQQAALQGTPLPLATVLRQPQAGTVRRVEGRGRLLPPLLLLDNQQRAGRVGLRAYAVSQVEAAERHLLVDLGWVAMSPARVVPSLTLPGGEVELAGLLADWPGQGLRLAEHVWPEQGASQVLLNHLDRDEIERALGVSLAPGVLRLSPGLDYGYARDLELLPNTLPPERHFGYAVQWFALAATVAVVYLLLSWRMRRRSSE